jgi:hypothetical protein
MLHEWDTYRVHLPSEKAQERLDQFHHHTVWDAELKGCVKYTSRGKYLRVLQNLSRKPFGLDLIIQAEVG